MIRFGTLDFGEEERQAILDLVKYDDSQLSMGKNVVAFEKEFAAWLGAKHAVMVNSGSSALLTAILAVKQTPKLLAEDFLSTTSLTFPAVWNAIRLAGLRVIAKDVYSGFNVELHAYPKEPLLAVHNLGKPCKGIDKASVRIEDASEALGSQVNGRKVGTFGLVGCFSFYVCHQLTTVEGGMVVINDSPYREKLYEACLSIRDNGRVCTCQPCTLKTSGKCTRRRQTKSVERRWETAFLGGNWKPTEFQATIGLVKLHKLERNLERRHEIYKRYECAFRSLPEEKGEYVVPMMYPVKVANVQKAVSGLEMVGIECRGMFPSYSDDFKNATCISKSYILLPLHHKLSDEDVECVIREAEKFLER